ncbi:MAG TPA: tetratricopeptide repeat protein [Pseudolabrys sp.]|nr:tetratricopeptide repeat protein [Pseudolabrys sp.]
MPSSPVSKRETFKVPQAFAQALEFHTQGRLNEAERIYSEVLAHRPDHFDALQMLSVIKLAKGQPGEALKLISQAMRMRKPSPQVLVNYGMILHALERSEEALASFDAALKQKSKFAEAHNNRGAVLSAMGRDAEAIDCFNKALALKPDYAEAHYNLGSSLRVLGRYDEALASLDRALALRPNYVKALNNRGAVMEGLNRLPEALVDYERALALDPGFIEARNNRGRVLFGLDRADDAVSNFTTALKINPRNAEAWYQRGRMLLEISRYEEAAADLTQALAIEPGHAEARLASCFAELPVIYKTEAEIARCRAAYEQKLRIIGEDAEKGALKGDLIKAIGARHPFLLAYQGDNDRALQEIYGGIVSRMVARRFSPPPLPPPPAPDEVIRVGIVSSFFYRHSNWKIPIKGWISQLDRKRFHVTGYHLGAIRDEQTEAASRLCDRFVHRTLDTDGWRREILADAPHILIYPGLLMDNSSIQLAAQRLARVQCNSWGHPETSGLPTMDYFLSSDLMEPPDADAFYTEKLVRLPNLSIYYEPVDTEPLEVTREELGLRPGATLFWSGQSLFKYLPQYDDALARIAREVGDCQFVFLRHFGVPRNTESLHERLKRVFAAAGMRVDDHCIFLNRLSQSKFVAAAGLCDVFLDSIGWSGCNSALECLRQALPIVTFEGKTMRGRHCAAILRMLGVPETIATTVDDYVAIASRLGRDKQFRQTMSARMAENRDKVYRDRAPVVALEDFIERSVRG